MIVEITDGKNNSYKEVFPDKELKEHYNECISNGANDWLKNIPFEDYIKPINIKFSDLDKYNKKDKNAHEIFGLIETIMQSDSCPQWAFNLNEENIYINTYKGDDINGIR